MHAMCAACSCVRLAETASAGIKLDTHSSTRTARALLIAPAASHIGACVHCGRSRKHRLGQCSQSADRKCARIDLSLYTPACRAVLEQYIQISNRRRN